MPQELSSRPQPQYWIKSLDPWMEDFFISVGLGFGTRSGRTQLFPTPALDKNRFPNIVCVCLISLQVPRVLNLVSC